MTRTARWTNLVAVFLPLVALAVAIVLLWGRAVDAIDLALLAAMYAVTGLGITVGFHRLLTHRSFAAVRPVELGLAVLGEMAVQGPAIDWVADHRKHHAHPDREGDPHSPHLHGDGVRGVVAGLWHAHMGWLFVNQGQAKRSRYARDLLDDPALRRINRAFPLIALAGIVLPGLAGMLLQGGLEGFARGALWGGLVRIALVHQATWSVNSLCHAIGNRRFATDDRRTNVPWLGLPTFGEAYHHNHHAFPRSYRHGLRWWDFDPSAWVIVVLERLGLARNVVRIAPERQRARLASSPQTGGSQASEGRSGAPPV
ncbi:MAG: fatty acid desaturase [Actinomycetota bacterium]|nr:fatty acid desaturase [Actinomycetota bacterium]